MTPRFVLSPVAADDLVNIWQYIREQSSVKLADRVESVIREKILFLARNPRTGHRRKELTDLPLRFFPVYLYLIVYRAEMKPLQVVAILHGKRDVESVLKDRLS
jgi:antitoxin ParD1/3/4